MENFINEIGITNTFIILLVLIFVLLILVITFMCKTIYLDKNDLVNGPFDLNQGNEISRYYKQDELKSLIVENNIKASKKLIAFVEDTEGKKKKKKICMVHNL